MKNSFGQVPIKVPRDREASFAPEIIPKHKTDVSAIEDKVLDELQAWQNRPLEKFYLFLFVDCMYVTLHKDYEVKECAVYTILGYDADGRKDVLGLWLNDSESKHTWMQIFDELKARGVEDIGFISMDGVSGLEEGARAIFDKVVVQRCIVHLIRNSLKYVPRKEYKGFTAQLKQMVLSLDSKLSDGTKPAPYG